MNKHHFYWLPNCLTSLRGVLGIGLLLCAINQVWHLGFWLFLLALVTDFLDGLAAKKLNAATALGAKLDPIVDCLLSACGLAGLAIAGFIPVWLIVIMGISALAIGYVKFLRSDHPTLQHAVQSVSVMYLFLVWGIVACGYASLAYGWSWFYPAIGLGLLVGAALLKRHRLRSWYGWLSRFNGRTS